MKRVTPEERQAFREHLNHMDARLVAYTVQLTQELDEVLAEQETLEQKAYEKDYDDGFSMGAVLG